MRLLRVELTRVRWRRAVLVLLAAAVLVPVVLAIVKVAELAPPAPDAYAQAVAAAEREAQQPYVQESIEDCIANPDDYVGTVEDVDGACRDSYAPVPEQFLPSSLDLAYEREDSGYVAAVFVGMIAILIGTTFVGHDWNTGSMGNQLLFESRRLRVWGAKAVAVTAATGFAAAVGLSAFWFVLAARFRLAGVHVPDGALLAGLEQGWRGAGVAALAALAGFAITMLSRSTVFTLGLLLGIAVAGGLLISFFVDDPGWVDPTVNVSAVIQDGTTYYVDVPESCYSDTSYDDTGDCASERRRSLGQGLGYLAILTPVVVGASAVSYRRRDVP